MKKTWSTMRMAALMAVLTVGAPVSAQVTIGLSAEPSEGALLDLKEYPSNQSVTSTKGLGLPRVSLTDLNELYPMLTSSTLEDKLAHIGLMVYNIEGDACPPILSGIYVWNGTEWVSLLDNDDDEDEGNFDPCNPGDAGKMTDPRDNEEYYTGNF
ncbi:MAG: hypothetical protein LBH12_01405, partial [Dysgonamonadaceae bacterium]|nr:hypothetical protein [Dysgonamonadaceae bacterium]